MTERVHRRTFVGVMMDPFRLLRTSRICRIVPVVAACLSADSAWPAVGLSVAVDDVQGEDWQLAGITLGLNSPRAGGMSVEIGIGRVHLPQRYGELLDVRLTCDEVAVADDGWRCGQGRLVAGRTPLQAQDTPWSGYWHTDGSIELNIPKLKLAGGTLAVTLSGDGVGWRADLAAYRLQVRRLAAIGDAVRLPRDWGIKGRLSGGVALSTNGQNPMRAKADLIVDRLGYASPDGSQAAENIVLKLDASARQVGKAWRFAGKLRWPGGALYSEPLFLDAGQGALLVDAAGRMHPGSQRLVFDSWSVELDETFHVSGTGEIDTADLDVVDLTIAAHSDDAGRLYKVLAQPFLIGTPADDMDVTGRVGFVLHVDDEGIEQAGLELNELTLNDRQGRFALRRTDGSVGWDRRKSVPVSRLTTQGVSILRISSDPFSIKARFAADRIDLVEPVVVPVLGGQVALDRFQLTGALVAGDKPHWTASASVRGVSLDQLTRELDWPPFSGVLSGELREMQYADRTFSIGGGLDLDAFDGTIRVSDLLIRDPLGSVPILSANAAMRGLSLKALTQTFAFGRIEGGLDADLADLRLVAWQPDRFDLHLYTPADDDSRHRISQRAVENLTELGSGVPAGLSTSLLGLFEEFGYDVIDVKILLNGNVADIDGLARKDGGYYLVRGSGLPRIDVIGRNRSVAWKDLLERLREIRVEGVQVQ